MEKEKKFYYPSGFDTVEERKQLQKDFKTQVGQFLEEKLNDDIEKYFKAKKSLEDEGFEVPATVTYQVNKTKHQNNFFTRWENTLGNRKKMMLYYELPVSELNSENLELSRNVLEASTEKPNTGNYPGDDSKRGVILDKNKGVVALAIDLYLDYPETSNPIKKMLNEDYRQGKRVENMIKNQDFDNREFFKIMDRIKAGKFRVVVAPESAKMDLDKKEKNERKLRM